MSVTTQNTTLRFFGEEWAEAARKAVDDGPDEAERATKLPTYWAWIERARTSYSYSWALGVRGRPEDLDGPSYLYLRWQDGRCAEASIIGSGEPVAADYVLVGDFAVWQGLLAGERDPQRLVMYRQLKLQEGSNTLLFFRGVYFFVESVGLIGRIPAHF
ncbi:hypothetical protein [Nonomuraea sp. NPDC002799]